MTTLTVGIVLILVPIQLAIGFFKFIDYESALTSFLSYFDTGVELSFPTWYASLLLAAAGVGSLFAVRASDARAARRGFGLLAVVMFYLSLDEATGLHERMSPVLWDNLDLPDFLTFAWVLPFAVLVGVITAMFVPFLRVLDRPIRIGLITAGVMYVFSGLGLEIVGSALFASGGPNVATDVTSIVEESGEMLGAILTARVAFLVALLPPGELTIEEIFMRREQSGQSAQ